MKGHWVLNVCNLVLLSFWCLTLQHRFKDKCFMTFEPLTLVPLQTKLIVKDLLTAEEVCCV